MACSNMHPVHAYACASLMCMACTLYALQEDADQRTAPNPTGPSLHLAATDLKGDTIDRVKFVGETGTCMGRSNMHPMHVHTCASSVKFVGETGDNRHSHAARPRAPVPPAHGTPLRSLRLHRVRALRQATTCTTTTRCTTPASAPTASPSRRRRCECMQGGCECMQGGCECMPQGISISTPAV